MGRNKMLLRVVLLGGLLTPFITSQNLPAGFSVPGSRLVIEIDGVNYGTFDRIEGLDELLANSSAPADDVTVANADFTRITLTRDFVTDPSLYLWAQSTMRQRSEPRDINILVESTAGDELARYVLRFCQPLSWSVEASNPSIGGFHETIDLAVQEISTL